MAAGDLKGTNHLVIKLTAGAAVVKGQVVHVEADDDKFDPVVDNDIGKFAVALEAASGDTVEFLAVIWGPVEVTATAAAIGKGSLVMAGTTGKVTKDDFAVASGQVGTAMEAFASGGVQTIFIGLVG